MKTTGELGSPAERSSGATSPERRSILVPFGPFEWLLVGYLVVSGLIHVGLGVTPLWRGDPFTRLHSFRIATGVFSLLLTGQLIHRVPVARYSISLIFIMQIGLFLKLYVIESLERAHDGGAPAARGGVRLLGDRGVPRAHEALAGGALRRSADGPERRLAGSRGRAPSMSVSVL
ncbi:MAG: hypothetical protein ACO4B3_06145 [Planctomycetota bacterium]